LTKIVVPAGTFLSVAQALSRSITGVPSWPKRAWPCSFATLGEEPVPGEEDRIDLPQFTILD
jgi:hypothetical protein